MSWTRHPTASSRITSTRKWRTHTRPTVLARDNHTCQLQYPDICTTTATQVDHITPAASGADPYDLLNLRGVCAPCHKQKTQQDALAARPTIRRPPEKHPGLL